MKTFNPLILISLLLLVGSNVNAQDFNGYALYNEQNQSTAYLIDKNGDIAHSWSCNTSGNYALALTSAGNLVRGGVYNGNQLNGAAVGGIIQEYDPSGNVVWEFVYSNSDYVHHHDLCLMPNGNVLFAAWEVKSTSELTQHGYDNPTSEKWPTHIIEVQQNGSGGEIVWEWHMWDHMVQDHDASKDNYGVVADHPELMNVNVPAGGTGPGPGGGGGDWFHVNGLDYNPALDQIVFTSRFLSEFFIIDHSTTTAEAAGHTGGNSGKGGDFLYRWGNPSNYNTSGTQVIEAAVHDPRWVKEGRPNAGFIQIFNNEGNNGSSAVDAIETPVNGYNYDLTPGQAYGPSTYSWRHECIDDADGQSASDRMPNGNIFVALSREYMYEVDASGNMIWQYNASPSKAFRYTCDDPGIKALLNVDCNCDADGSAELDDCNICAGGNTGVVACTSNGIEELFAESISIFPNPSQGVFEIAGIDFSSNDYQILVSDMYGNQIKVLSETNKIDLSTQAVGIYHVSIIADQKTVLTRKVSVIR